MRSLFLISHSAIDCLPTVGREILIAGVSLNSSHLLFANDSVIIFLFLSATHGTAVGYRNVTIRKDYGSGFSGGRAGLGGNNDTVTALMFVAPGNCFRVGTCILLPL